MKRPKLLDLFSKAGGAGQGYNLAGFDVTGIDIDPQPRYKPGRFVQSDAFLYLEAHWREYDAFHASPPCQFYSEATASANRVHHPDWIGRLRDFFLKTGKPYVIENVSGAAAYMDNPVMLCGVMFPELRVYRHRLFECSFFVLSPPHYPHRDNCHGNGMVSKRGYVNVFGGGGHTDYKRQAMGVDWMTRDELSQAIPPAYTKFIGWHLMRVL